MIHDNFRPDTIFEYDLCVIGSGPSGMTVATELSQTNLRICVVESGKEERSQFIDKLREVVEDGLPIRMSSRERILGGSTGTWSGMSALFDPIDFEKRADLPSHTGWPIASKELVEYLEIASRRYRFPEPCMFAPDGLFTKGEMMEPGWKQLEPKVFIAVHPPTRYKDFKYVFDGRDGMDLFTNVTVISLSAIRSVTGIRVTEAVGKTQEGQVVRIRARVFVLAAGAIENARILLNSTSISPSGLGNEHDQVGRYLMNHPKGTIGHIYLKKAMPNVDSYIWTKRRSLVGYIGLRLSENMQRAQGILNAYVRLEPEFPWTDRAEMKLLGRVVDIGRVCWRSIIALDILGTAQSLREGLALVPSFVIASPAIMYLSFLRSMYGSHPEPKRLRLRYFLEMEPQMENRITLAKDRDAHGISLPHVHHELSDRDVRSFRMLQDTLAKEVEHMQLGTFELTEAERQQIPRDDASHHLGVTRMGSDPATSVVDPHLRIHSVENLFIAGGSVFPTSGCANPTMLMAALSIRLAQHLKERVFNVTDRVYEPSTESRAVLLIGAGGRVHADIIPVIESMSEMHISRIFARTSRTIFGTRAVYDVSPLEELRTEDIAAVKMVYFSVPPQEVPQLVRMLATHDCSHIDLVLPTPLPQGDLPYSAFARVIAEEDSVYLPWVSLLRRIISTGAIGSLKKIVLDRSAYRYHAIALVKTLCRGVIQFGFKIGRHIFVWCRGVQVQLIEPRDYATGHLHLVGEKKRISDRSESGSLAIELIREDDRCTGTCLGEECEQLSPEESRLVGAVTSDDTVITQMHAFKRVGLRRLLQDIVRGGNVLYSHKEGMDDARVDSVLHRFWFYWK